MEKISKISLKMCDALPAKKSLKPGEAFAVLRVFGVASKHETATTSSGDAEKLKGTFEAITLATGKHFAANAAFLPQEATDALADAIAAIQGSVEFSFELGVTHTDKGNLGYLYTIKSLREMAPQDPLRALREHASLGLTGVGKPSDSSTEDKPVSKRGRKK